MSARALLERLLTFDNHPMNSSKKPPVGAAPQGLEVLLGERRASRYAANALSFEGLVGLGAIAATGYGYWQARPGTGADAVPLLFSPERLVAMEAQTHAWAMLKALIGGAKADGHIGGRECLAINRELARLTPDTDLLNWLEAELAQPLDAASVARAAISAPIAMQMYVITLWVADTQAFTERCYLDELCRHLHLDPALRIELDNQVRRREVL